MRPIFIFCLPRTGSTLLQRILVSTGRVSTSSEPWILLPFLYSIKRNVVLSDYWHRYAVTGIEEFVAGLPNGKEDYFAEIASMVTRLYEKRSENKMYFLDKTPRYHLIANEIFKLFPEGKFILLWRNPLSMISSIVNTWCKGDWKVSRYKIDIYDGIFNLIRMHEEFKDKIHIVRYEALLNDPCLEIRQLCNYLEFDFEERFLSEFKDVKLEGRLGDKLGVAKYTELSAPKSDSWAETFSTPYRRWWALKYLKKIGKQNLDCMGYDCDELANILKVDKRVNPKLFVRDLLMASYAANDPVKALFEVKRNFKYSYR